MDEIGRDLKALGERVGTTGLVTTPDFVGIIRRARIRKATAALASTSLIAAGVFGGFAGLRAVGPRLGAGKGSVLAAAAETTEGQGTARVEFDMRRAPQGGFAGTRDITTHGSGEIDFEAQRSYIRFETDDMALMGTGTIEMIQDGTTIYTKGIPSIARVTSADEDFWVRTDLETMSQGAVDSFAVHTQSPSDYLTYLKSISDEIEIVGQEEIDGASVTHYRATIDHERAPRQIEGARAEGGTDYGDLNVEFGPADVWVDDQGRIRQMTMATRVKSDGGAEIRRETSFSMRLSDFGVPVRIQLPHPEDVVEQEILDNGSVLVGEGIPENDALDETLLLMSEHGRSGPAVAIRDATSPDRVCIMQAPKWVSFARVVEQSSGKTVIIIAAALDGSNVFIDPFEGERSTCGKQRLTDALAQELEEHPERFELDLEAKGNRRRTIHLTDAERL